MIKILQILYFVVLFFILGSYVITSIPDDSIRMHIVTADELSQKQNNIIGITARNLDNGSQFKDWSVRTQWVDSDLQPLPDVDTITFKELQEFFENDEIDISATGDSIHLNDKGRLKFPRLAVTKKIARDGADIMNLPRLPTEPCVGLEVQLLDPQDEVIKSALIPNDVFFHESFEDRKIQVIDPSMEGKRKPILPSFTDSDLDNDLIIRGQAYTVKPDYVSVNVPAAFMLGQPNEVHLIAFEDEKPFEGMIEIEQIYGAPTTFPKQIKANALGITTFEMTLNSAADFKITAGKQVIYPSFVIHERNIHVTLNGSAVYFLGEGVDEAVTLVANVTPVGQMPKLYIDYFDGNAWIDRQIIEPSQNYKASVELRTRYRYAYGSLDDVINKTGADKDILYIRVSSSAYATPETSQTFAVLTSSNLFECAGALDALKFLEPYKAGHPKYELLKRVAKNKSSNTKDCKELGLIRDEALAMLASHHNPQLAIRVKTEEADALAYDARKLKQKSIANVILVIWFALGVIVGSIVVIHQMVRQKEYWNMVAASGEAEMGKPIPHVHPFLAFVLFMLIIGLCVSLYYMMQLL